MVAAASSLTGNICIWFLVIWAKIIDNDNEDDDDDDGKLEENVDISEELTTLPLATWVALAGIFNGQPHQDLGDQEI